MGFVDLLASFVKSPASIYSSIREKTQRLLAAHEAGLQGRTTPAPGGLPAERSFSRAPTSLLYRSVAPRRHGPYSSFRTSNLAPPTVNRALEAEATRAAILLELRKANDIEMDAAARKAEAEAKRAAALHKLLRDEQLAADRAAKPAVSAAAQQSLPRRRLDMEMAAQQPTDSPEPLSSAQGRSWAALGTPSPGPAAAASPAMMRARAALIAEGEHAERKRLLQERQQSQKEFQQAKARLVGVNKRPQDLSLRAERAMAAGAPSPVEQSERSLTAARAQEMLLLEEEKRRLEASRLRYAAAVPLPPDAGSPVPFGELRLPEVSWAAPSPAKAKREEQRSAQPEEDGVVVLSSDDEEEEEQAEEEEEEQVVTEEEESLSAALDEARIKDEGQEVQTRRRLTRKQQELVARALADGDPREILAYHKSSNIEMSRGHMACLKGLNWLNDEVMNIYMGMLLDRDAERREKGLGPRCHFFNSFFLNKLYKDTHTYNYKAVRRWTLPKKLKLQNQQSESILDVERVIVPVHLGNHWTCALIDLVAKEIVYYDSLGGREDKILRALRSYIADEYRDKRDAEVDTSEWPIRYPADVPLQQNGCDCGVFALQFAEHLSRGVDLSFSQLDMPYFRTKIAADIMAGHVD
ncbi:g7725 [Coccomyxa elongata]